MNKTINLGILGAGSVFRNMHLPALLGPGKKFRIAAVCDPDKDALRNCRKLLYNTGHNPCYSGDPQEIFSEKKLDAIAVLTPTAYHVKYTIEALKSGKHVFLEKPAAVNSADIKKIISAEKKYKKTVQVGMVLRHSSFYKALSKIINSGRYGRVLWMNWLETRPFDPARWRYSSTLRNGDAIIHDKAIHQVNLFNAFAGAKADRAAAFGGQLLLSNKKYSKVRAFSNEVMLKGDSNDHLLAVISYKNGVKASLTVSYVSPQARESRWIIQLEKAKLAAHFETFVNKEKSSKHKWKGNPSSIYLYADNKSLDIPWKYPMSYPPSEKNLVFYDEYPDEPMHPGSGAQWAAFYDSIVRKKRTDCSTKTAFEDALVIDGITRSVKQNKMIKIKI